MDRVLSAEPGEVLVPAVLGEQVGVEGLMSARSSSSAAGGSPPNSACSISGLRTLAPASHSSRVRVVVGITGHLTNVLKTLQLHRMWHTPGMGV